MLYITHMPAIKRATGETGMNTTMSNYKQNIDKTIENELRARCFKTADQLKVGAHKESTIPRLKQINKLMKYWKRAKGI